MNLLCQSGIGLVNQSLNDWPGVFADIVNVSSGPTHGVICSDFKMKL